MKLPLCFLLVTGACGGGYVKTRVVHTEPASRVYEVRVEHAVDVTRDVLERRGYRVFRVAANRDNRIVWARRGNEMVRIFLTPRGRRVEVRGIVESRDRGRRRGWTLRGASADEIVGDIDIRLRTH